MVRVKSTCKEMEHSSCFTTCLGSIFAEESVCDADNKKWPNRFLAMLMNV